ncbi:GumC family protein [Dyadobacter alkalitolerans]|uniref:GumC family protein n=1 Tax=Dyadobacter alkalitolerans TaxID=492736 RepID=UPI00041FDE32|nr:tyrosine-protein kinase [Dyadobacter alkalitolerans]
MSGSVQWNDDQEDDFSFLEVLFKILRYWYWFVFTVGISLFAAYYYLKQYTPIYRMSSTVLIKEERSLNTNNIVDQLALADDKNLDNEMNILKSRPLLEKVVANLGLTVTYWHEGKNRDTEIYTCSPVSVEAEEILSGEPFFIKPIEGNRYELWNQDKIKLGRFLYSEKLNSKYGKFRVFRRKSMTGSDTLAVKIIMQSTEAVVNGLISDIQIGLQSQKSTLVSLSIENPLPSKGKDILSNLLEEYSFATLAAKNREASNTLRFIEDRLKIVSMELGDVEQNVEQFRTKQRITDLSTEANLFLDKVQENDSKLNEVNINLSVLEGVESYVNSNEVGNIAPASLGVNDAVLTSYISQLSQLESERLKLSQTVQEGNPYLKTLNTQMRNVRQAIQENLKNQRSSLLVSRKSLQTLNGRLTRTISKIPKKEREFVGIKRQAGVKENLYLLLLQKREETALSYASTVTDNRVVEPPYSVPGIVRPEKRKIYSYAIIIGLLIPIGLILVSESMKNTVQSKKEIERKTGLKVFGEISVMAHSGKGQVIDLSSRSLISEQIRMIRSNMQYLFLDNNKLEGKTLIITSSTAAEGKSFITLNIAAALAILDKKVLILGLDLRKPKVHEYMGVSNKVGLSNYLIGQAKEEDIIQSTSSDNLFIIPSGPIPPNPSELISKDSVAKLIASLRQTFDYIIIDTPPVTVVTDTILLAPLADATFYIVRHQETPKIHLNTIKDLNMLKQFKSLNIIFNAVNYRKNSTYGYYGKQAYYGQERTSWIKSLFERH